MQLKNWEISCHACYISPKFLPVYAIMDNCQIGFNDAMGKYKNKNN